MAWWVGKKPERRRDVWNTGREVVSSEEELMSGHLSLLQRLNSPYSYRSSLRRDYQVLSSVAQTIPQYIEGIQSDSETS